MLAWGALEEEGQGGREPASLSPCSGPGTAAALEAGASHVTHGGAEPLGAGTLCLSWGHAVRGPSPTPRSSGGMHSLHLQKLRTGAQPSGARRVTEGLHPSTLSPCSAVLGGGRAPACMVGVSLLWRLGGPADALSEPPLSDTPAQGESSKPG